MVKRVICSAYIYLFIALLISGGASRALEAASTTPHDTLIYEAYAPSHINPISFRQSGAIEILVKWCFESLLAIDPITGDNIPLLAKRWKIRPDGKSFTFWLDERATFFDGRPVLAEDVKFSFEVFKMPKVRAAFRKAKLLAFRKIEILGERVIRFTSKQRLFNNFEFLISTLILPKHLYFHPNPEVRNSSKYLKLPLGSGPYRVSYWNRGDRAVLLRNPNYWGRDLKQNRGAYRFKKIIIRYIRDPQIAFEMLKKGDIDYMPIRIGSTELWRQTESDRAFLQKRVIPLKVRNRAQSGYGFLAFNLRDDLFKSVRVRMALAMAINRQQMIDKNLKNLATIPLGPLFSLENFSGNFTSAPFAPAKALKILRSEGWEDSDGDYILDKGGRKFTFTVLVPNARIEREMLFVQHYLKQIGVLIRVKILEYSTWRELQDERKFEAISNGKSRTLLARNVDPFGEWHSSNTSSGLRNYYGFSSSKVDRLIEQGRGEYCHKSRKEIFNQVNDLIASSYAMIQYSESLYSLHGVSSKVVLPKHNGERWYPYDLGMKYWYKKR